MQLSKNHNSKVNKMMAIRKEGKCPTCVRRYNIFMGGVDLCDQYRKVLSCSKKTIKWYMRLVTLMFVSSMLLFWIKRSN